MVALRPESWGPRRSPERSLPTAYTHIHNESHLPKNELCGTYAQLRKPGLTVVEAGLKEKTGVGRCPGSALAQASVIQRPRNAHCFPADPCWPPPFPEFEVLTSIPSLDTLTPPTRFHRRTHPSSRSHLSYTHCTPHVLWSFALQPTSVSRS